MSGQAFGQDAVVRGAGGTLEHDRVGNDGGSHQPCQLGGRHQAVLLEHLGDDGGGGTDRLVPHKDRIAGLNVREAVVVDDPDDLGLIQPGDCLAEFVVIHEDDLFPAGTDQVITGQGADHFVLVIQDGIGAETALKNRIPHVVQVIRQVEELQAGGAGDPADWDGLEDQPGSPVGVEGTGHHAGGSGTAAVLLAEGSGAEDQTGGSALDRPVRRLLLVAAEHDRSRPDGRDVTGKGDDHLAGNLVNTVLLGVDDMAFHGAEQVIDRDGGYRGIRDGFHIVLGQAAGGDQAEKAAVLPDDRQGRYVVSRIVQHLPGMGKGNALADQRGCVKIDIGDLGADRAEINGRLETEAIQQKRCFRVQMAVAGGNITVVAAQRILQGGVGHGGHDGIRVRVFMTDHINRIHDSLRITDS